MGCARSRAYGADVRRGDLGPRKASKKPVRFGPRNDARNAGALAFPTASADELFSGGAAAAARDAYGVESDFYKRGAAQPQQQQQQQARRGRALDGDEEDDARPRETPASRRRRSASRQDRGHAGANSGRRQRPAYTRSESEEEDDDDDDDEAEVDVYDTAGGFASQGVYGAGSSGLSRRKSKLRARVSLGRRKAGANAAGAQEYALAPSMMQEPEIDDADPWDRDEEQASRRNVGSSRSSRSRRQDAPMPPPAFHRAGAAAPSRNPSSSTGVAVRKSLGRIKKQLQSGSSTSPPPPPPPLPLPEMSPYPLQKKSSRSPRRFGADDLYDDDASSVSVSSSERTTSRRYGGQSALPPSRRTVGEKPWLGQDKAQSGTPRFSSDTPVGRSWDRIQAVAARKSGDSEQYRSPYYR